MSSIYYLDNEFQLMNDNKNNSCSICRTCSSCVSNIYSCVCLPVRICMGLSWIATSGFFFYMGTLYNSEKEKLLNITLH